jgi:hypothetical protein
VEFRHEGSMKEYGIEFLKNLYNYYKIRKKIISWILGHERFGNIFKKI